MLYQDILLYTYNLHNHMILGPKLINFYNYLQFKIYHLVNQP